MFSNCRSDVIFRASVQIPLKIGICKLARKMTSFRQSEDIIAL